ncbi:MAG: AarF/ABC1/UbiB kinase family protein [Alcanivorax sp.]|nr:AarF/ABC1/UbiB kinase family protein [Alcanivorax sp.]
MAKRRDRAASTGGRFWKLTGMTTSIATRVAGQQVRGWFQSDQDRQASREELMRHIGREVAATLGQMKGAVMKVGQIASQMQDVLPREISEQLAVLQNASAPMPFHVIRRQLEKELGGPVAERFADFQETPFAAASIGQVHRATTLDGEPVVVKVQYPAVKSSIDSDMKHLKRILKLGSLLRVDERALDAVFREIRQQLDEELDYHREAENLRLFREFHRADADVVIPRVFEALSGATVLTLSLEEGTPLDQVNDDNGFDQDLRNRLGERLFDLLARQIFQLHAVHCDPHPGNFAFRSDGSIVFYDFGAVKRLPEEDVALMATLTDAALQRDWARLDQALLEIGARRADTRVADSFYDAWVPVLMQGVADTPYDFATARVHQEVVKKARTTPWEDMLKFQPSSRTLLVQRVVGGHYWTLKNLGVASALRPRLRRILDERAA